jgi:glycosyltransferase involved in cell wall biosynthesis
VRKDLDTLLIAYSKSKLRGQVPLVIAGELRERKPALARLGAELGLGDDLKLLGYVDEELLPALYRTALVHVFPSRYEGFGLPVLEAMASGAPTITSPGSSLDEVAGDAAWIVPCGQVDDMLHALERLAEDAGARADLRQKGLVRAASFTWEATARGTREFWRQHELLA